MKSIISTSDAECGASSHGGLGRRLPIRSQLDEVTLTLTGDLSKCLNTNIGDATPFEGDEKTAECDESAIAQYPRTIARTRHS